MGAIPVVLSEAKDLLSEKQVLRFAQDDMPAICHARHLRRTIAQCRDEPYL